MHKNMHYRHLAAVFLVICLGLAGALCNPVEPADHYVRIKNNYKAAFARISIGEAVFTNVRPGDETTYRPAGDGDQAVAGECPPFGKLTGTLSLSGAGRHLWTVVVGVSGYLTVIEDTQP